LIHSSAVRAISDGATECVTVAGPVPLLADVTVSHALVAEIDQPQPAGKSKSKLATRRYPRL
jgi:hypothetical protein